MSIEFRFRILGMVLFAVLGARFGVTSADSLRLPEDANGLIFSLVGALVGLIMTPWLTTRPAKSIQRALLQTPIEVLSTALIGLIVGLVVALLLVWPLSLLPDVFGQYLPFVTALVCAYFGFVLFSSRSYDIVLLIKRALGRVGDGINMSAGAVLVDTSVIIDGRILELSSTGFIPGTILIPQFVLSELQHIANSSDPLRRQRGRYGLEVLNNLRKDGLNPVEVIEDDPENIEAVDTKLVEVAKLRNTPLMTNDFNLEGVAGVHGVMVLNINKLSLALQPSLLPGEDILVHIIAEGQQQNQGVGYLKDGTMVVVEDGRRYLDRSIPVVVTRYIRSAAGKMYFGVHADQAKSAGIH
jgi:uncharacterized protein YacL